MSERAINDELLQAIIAYLEHRPHREVWQAIAELRTLPELPPVDTPPREPIRAGILERLMPEQIGELAEEILTPEQQEELLERLRDGGGTP